MNNQKGRLADFLRAALDRAAQSRWQEEPHPVLVVNALKNIIGDNRETPPPDLWERIEEYLSRFSPQDDWKPQPEPSEDFARGAIFTMDLKEAVLSADWAAAGKYAGDLYLAAENKNSVLEILAETALSDVERHATFFYHLFRAMAFYQPPTARWHYILAGLEQLRRNTVEERPPETGIEPNDLIPAALWTLTARELPTFAAVYRLWEMESVRITGFRQKMAGWLWARQKECGVEPAIPAPSQVEALRAYKEKGGGMFIELALPPGTELEPHRILFLEAVRFLVRVTPQDYINILAHRLEEGIET